MVLPLEPIIYEYFVLRYYVIVMPLINRPRTRTPRPRTFRILSKHATPIRRHTREVPSVENMHAYIQAAGETGHDATWYFTYLVQRPTR